MCKRLESWNEILNLKYTRKYNKRDGCLYFTKTF